MATEYSDSRSEDSAALRREFSRARRFGLCKRKISQELIAWYMRSSQGSVASDENLGTPWKPGIVWHLRRAVSHGLIKIGVSESQSMDFWHEVNKYWVAAGYSGPLVPDPFEECYEQLLDEVYADIAKAKENPAYQKYEAGCRRMRENSSS